VTHENRIQQLENRCRRLNAAVIVLVALMGIALFARVGRHDAGADADGRVGRHDAGADADAGADGRVRTQKLEIVDSEGTVRIALGEGDDHGYGVILNDPSGKFRVALFEAPRAAGLNITKGSAYTLLVGEDSSSFSLRKAGGTARAVVSVTQDGARMQLRDQQGEVVFPAPQAK